MVGKMLKILRSNKDYNQTELAELLNIAQTTLSGYETNYSNPKFEVINRIAEICGYEIIFRNKSTKQEIGVDNFERMDIIKNRENA